MVRMMSGILASLVLAGSVHAQDGPQAETPLTDKLAATLGDRWWCGGETVTLGSTECESLQRFVFIGRTPSTIEYCNVIALDDIRSLSDGLQAMAPSTFADSERFFSDIAARGRAHGADRIKLCESVKVSRSTPDTICVAVFQRQANTRVALSRTGRWRDPDDVVLTDAEVDRLYASVKAFAYEMIESLPEKERGALADMMGTLSGGETCDRFALRADGAVIVRPADPDPEDQTPPFVFFPVAGPEAVALVPYRMF